jgi:hypothetical protein
MSLDISLHQDAKYNTEVYEANITHNLGKMAGKVSCFILQKREEKPKEITLYDILWHGSGQSGLVIAPMLEVGLHELKENREIYEEYNPENGWGDYEKLVKFTQELLFACKEFPETTLYCHR